MSHECPISSCLKVMTLRSSFQKVTSQSQAHDQHISINRNVVTQEIHMNMKALLYPFWVEFYDQDLVYMDRRPNRQSDS